MKKHLIMVVLSVLLGICNRQFTCDPAIDCSNVVKGDLVPDCEYYYVCVLLPPDKVIPTGVPFKCQSGMYFYQGNATCIDETEPCRNQCKPKCNSQFACDPAIDCSNAEVGDLVPDPEDCEYYYVCILLPPDEVIPTGVPIKCPSGMYFYQENATCIDETEPCRNQCKPDYIKYTCDPVADCQTAEVGGLVPDPENCEKYFMCVLIPPDNHVCPSATSFFCPDGMYFNQVTGSCDTESTPCQNICAPEFVQCITQCPPLFEGVKAVANKTDCSYFTVCRNGSQSLARCPEDSPFFNGSECVSDATQCCNFCNPYCTQIGFQIQDPCDCTSFYVCTDVGLVANDSVSNPCGPGQHFEEGEGTCADGTCKNICHICETTTLTSWMEPEISTGSLCTAYCMYVGIEVQNPCDCTSLYICLEVGPVPDDATSYQCSSGQYFDETVGSCIDGACNNKCPYCG